MVKLSLIDCGVIKCDGGATFGVVPKVLWQKKYPCDEDNFCAFSMRSLVIDNGQQRILVDTGTGTKQSDKFFANNGVSNHHRMMPSLLEAGYQPKDITDVLLTHLHYDHCGGAVCYNDRGELVPAFPNATYWCSRTQWENYLQPNIREGSVYFPENMMPLQERGLLKLVDQEGDWYPGVSLRIFNGHTPGLLLPLIDYQQNKLFYVGDFIPLAANVPLAWVAAYDTSPLVSMEEKQLFLKEAHDQKYILVFQHDALNECCSLTATPKGIAVERCFSLDEI